jgi:hypothetical protein
MLKPLLSLRGLAATLIAAGLAAGCGADPDSSTTTSTSYALVNTPGQPGGACGFVEVLPNGAALVSVKFPGAKQYVEVFIKKNGVQTVAQSLPGTRQADGSFVYRYQAPVNAFVAGDKIAARFYHYDPNQPGNFTPGPTATTWLPDFTYGSATCTETLACGETPANPSYIRKQANGSLKVSVTLPSQQTFVQAFVLQNGVQNVAANIVGSGVVSGGTTTYSYTIPAANLHTNDQIGARFYSYKGTSPAVFTPGPIENVWGPLFVYGVTELDSDNDGVTNCFDVCPMTPDPSQADGDHDGRGDACDNCPAAANASQADIDHDGAGDACDICPHGEADNGVACNDGNACTTADTCQHNACAAGAPVVCPAPADECQIVAICSAATGTCPAPANKADGTTCRTPGNLPGTCMAGTCKSTIDDTSFVVTGAGPAPGDPGLLFSQYDNPQVNGTDEMRNFEFEPGMFFPEHADSTGLPNVWGYRNFNLVIRGTGDDTMGTRPMTALSGQLIPRPTMAGIFDPPMVLPFTARGFELGYSIASLTGIHQQLDDTVRTSAPLRVQLDPTVMLVPIQIVQVLPPATASFLDDLKNISVEERNQLFDDRLRLTHQFVSHPGGAVHAIENYAVQGLSPGAAPLSFTEPDMIWSQCGIQFRAVSCSPTPEDPGSERCPTLTVTQPLAEGCNVTAEGRVRLGTNLACECSNFILEHNEADARALPGVRADLPLVMFTGTVQNPQCLNDAADRSNTGIGHIAVLAQDSTTKQVLAHALGHVLGLNDNDLNEMNLMHKFAAQQSTFIPQNLCKVARSQAAQYVKAKWGVTVDPAVWANTPAASRF